MTLLVLALLAVTGTWLSPNELAVQADVPAITLPADYPWAREVPWIITAYRYDEGCATWPCWVARAIATVPEGQAATIAATLRISTPRRGWGTVIIRLTDGRHYSLDQQVRVKWPYAILLNDTFETCCRRICSQALGDPPPYDPPRLCYLRPSQCDPLCSWSDATGFDPAKVFSDGFESGDLRQWEASGRVPILSEPVEVLGVPEANPDLRGLIHDENRSVRKDLLELLKHRMDVERASTIYD